MIIIANPPYSLGNQITSTVLNNVDFDEYVNLMPVSYYRKNKLFQHMDLSTIEKVSWEGDADVIPYLVKLNKNAETKRTWESMAVHRYNSTFRKFYIENQKRKHYAIDAAVNDSIIPSAPSYDTTFFLATRAVMGISKTLNCHDYRWNVLKNEPLADISDPCKNGKTRLRGTFVYFNTKEEKDNLCSWWYESKIENRILKGLNKQSGTPTPAIPKVDWSHKWTDEEILKDYGYTDEEIKELLL